MAKTAKEKTPISKAADAAREAYSKAKDANAKADNATTKKALADAKTVRDNAVKAEARERFVSIGDARVKNAVKVIGNIGKMNQPRNYNYSESDVAVIEKLLSDAVKATVSSLRTAITSGGTAADTGTSNIFSA